MPPFFLERRHRASFLFRKEAPIERRHQSDFFFSSVFSFSFFRNPCSSQNHHTDRQTDVLFFEVPLVPMLSRSTVTHI